MKKNRQTKSKRAASSKLRYSRSFTYTLMKIETKETIARVLAKVRGSVRDVRIRGINDDHTLIVLFAADKVVAMRIASRLYREGLGVQAMRQNWAVKDGRPHSPVWEIAVLTITRNAIASAPKAAPRNHDGGGHES